MARTLLGTDEVKTIACHFEEELSIIRNVVLDYMPNLMIELGTCVGGVTFIMHQCFPSTPLHTFDNKDMVASIPKSRGKFSAEEMIEFKEKEFGNSVVFHVVDIFEEGKQFIEALLELGNRTFLYCDNGNKVDEINTFAKHMKAGDLLGVHDWHLEIDYTYPGIKDSLSTFKEHPANDVLRAKALTSRFFEKYDECFS